MTEKELHKYLNENYSQENEKCEWKEFKFLKNAISGNKGSDVITYISAIANMNGGHLIIGVEDKTLNIVGIHDFADYNINNIKFRVLGNCPNLNSDLFIVNQYITSDTNKIIWVFQIPKHQFRLPVYAHKKTWQRIDGNLVEMTKSRLDAIINEIQDNTDWSAEILTDATLNDLEPKAIAYAKEKFLVKFPELKEDLEKWDDITFLNKAKITIKGQITRTSIILLGKSEAESYLIPSIAKMRWVLKTIQNEEKDYDIFPPPFLLAIDKVYEKIRNLKYRYLPKGTLFPNELLRYEPFNIREAISNCVAHNDYSKAGYINIIEFEDERLVFSNNGDFIPGSIEKVIMQDAPEENYRNRFLANAMFQLGLVDTRGGGIKKIYTNQIKRFFPLPDYDFESGKTQMTLIGKILDIEFVDILSHHPNLAFADIFLLDLVQKKKEITDDNLKYLKRLGFVEGRKPNIYLSHSVIDPLNNEGLKAEYIRNKGFDDEYYKNLIIEYLVKWKETSRKQIENLLWDKLSDVLNESSKFNKVSNLLRKLRVENKIELNKGKKWILKK